MPICGLEALFWQVKNDSNFKNYDFVACLLNAYSGQIFASVYHQKTGTPLSPLQSRCLSAQEFIKEVCALGLDKILLVGNGCGILLKAIEEGIIDANDAQRFIVDQRLISVEPNAQTIALLAYQKVTAGGAPQSKIIPNYIKSSFDKKL